MRKPDADDVQIGLEVYRQHIAETTRGTELVGGGRRRLPRTLRNDDGQMDLDLCRLGHRAFI